MLSLGRQQGSELLAFRPSGELLSLPMEPVAQGEGIVPDNTSTTEGSGQRSLGVRTGVEPVAQLLH
ncbi:MAG: hypothetical protein OXI08_02790 [Cyanobacteria bacterium MAG IRC4_bin_6]|nr:hypothetical protein [Cyanobacteria bacterium MAG IRC4_bin_6]